MGDAPTPTFIRLIDCTPENPILVEVPLDEVTWNQVWGISHVWDKLDATLIPVKGVTWTSNAFSQGRFDIIFKKTVELIRPRGGRYVWADAACIIQGDDADSEVQIAYMKEIYKLSAGTVAFGTMIRREGQSPRDVFSELVDTYGDGNEKEAWVNDWFERVWTYQELQLPQQILFVFGDRVMTRNEVYLAILLMSPFLTRHPRIRPARIPVTLEIADVVNALSPFSKTNTQRALMQSSLRSGNRLQDRVYGILGVLVNLKGKVIPDYDKTFGDALLDLMRVLKHKDVLDTLTFNQRAPTSESDDYRYRWSGMIRFGDPMEHPSYETDIYYGTDAEIVVEGDVGSPRVVTKIKDAQLWTVVVTPPPSNNATQRPSRDWPSLALLAKLFNVPGDFSNVKFHDGYPQTVGRVVRSLGANWEKLKHEREEGLKRLGLEKNDHDEKIRLLLEKNPAKRGEADGIPLNRLGDSSYFDKELTVLMCRSKKDGSFHYGIVVEGLGDGRYIKLCTASFSDKCLVKGKLGKEEVMIV